MFPNRQITLFAIVAGCAAAMSQSAWADVIQVPSKQAPTIQAGIDLAVGGDTVLVGPGTYNEAIDFLGKTIIVESSGGAEATIIDATGLDTSVVTVASGEAVGTELRGFTITGGIGSFFPEGKLDGDGRGRSRWQAVELLVQTSEGAVPAGGGVVAGGGTRYGGGVYVSGAAILIENCIVIGNHVPAEAGSGGGGGFLMYQTQDVQLLNCIIEDNSAWLGGGGLLSSGSITVTDCTFRNNAAGQGGGLNVNNMASATVIASVFEANTAGHVQETAEFGGGAMVLSNATASFSQCQFKQNTSLREGGGLRASGAGTTLDQCVFEQNIAVRGGGAYSSGTLNVLSCQFIENQAVGNEPSVGGGGLYVNPHSASSITNIDGSTFIGNSASGASSFIIDSGGGGALLSRDFTMTDCTFDGNTSDVMGGGVNVVLSTARPSISDCTFTNNVGEHGGGICVWTNGQVDASIDVVDCHFEANSAETGGAFRRGGDDGGSLISGCTFIDNSAIEYGGAMMLSMTTHEAIDERMTVVACEFIGNSATEGSGAGGAVMITSQFQGSARVDFKQCQFKSNSAWLGGAAIVSQTGSLNPWPPSRFIDCTFKNNSAVDGGAININSGGSAIVSGCEFNTNTATAYGGAVIFLPQSLYSLIETSHFSGNSANFGGAMSMTGSPSQVQTINGCTFEANAALTDGGAIFGVQAYTASHCQFIGNTAGQRGGAILAEGQPHIFGGTFTGNSAGDEGGAIFSPDAPGAKLQSVLICSNSPDNVVGAFEDLGNNVIDDTCHSGVVIHVPQDYATIQEAIDAAYSGDEIVVAPGLYVETINYSGKRLVVRSSDGPEVTIIDPTAGLGAGLDTGRVVTVNSGEGPGTTLRGFTITGGSGTSGGGVLVHESMLLIEDCIINANGGSAGAGVSVVQSQFFAEVTIINSRISNNTGGNFGGGVRAQTASAHLVGTIVENNSAVYGGGIALIGNGSATCSDCEIRDNVATAVGGGVGMTPGSDFMAVDSLFCGNAPDAPVVHLPSGTPWTEGDLGGNVFLDDCPAQPIPGDLDGDGAVDVSDLLILLGAWGPCGDGNNCPADLNADGDVDVTDLLLLLQNWG